MVAGVEAACVVVEEAAELLEEAEPELDEPELPFELLEADALTVSSSVTASKALSSSSSPAPSRESRVVPSASCPA